MKTKHLFTCLIVLSAGISAGAQAKDGLMGFLNQAGGTLNSLLHPANIQQATNSCVQQQTQGDDGGSFGLNIANCQSSDSSFVINGSLPPANTFLIVTMTNTDTKQTVTQNAVPITASSVNARLYLPAGAGNYNVAVWAGTDSKYYADFLVTNSDTRNTDGLLPSATVQSDNADIIALSQKIITAQNAQSDREKLQALHDWLILNVQYDSQNVTYDTNSQKWITKGGRIYDALDVLHSGPPMTAICQGYSSLYAALARAAGIRAHIIYGNIIYPHGVDPSKNETWAADGKKQVHVWNQFFIEGRWINVDATWDGGGLTGEIVAPESVKSANHQKYFDPSDSDFGVTHGNPVTQIGQ